MICIELKVVTKGGGGEGRKCTSQLMWTSFFFNKKSATKLFNVTGSLPFLFLLFVRHKALVKPMSNFIIIPYKRKLDTFFFF